MIDYRTLNKIRKVHQQKVAEDILNIIDFICYSKEMLEFRVNYGSKGQIELVKQKIKEKYLK